MGIRYFGFVYIWFDMARLKYYIGSHWGHENDGYICSSKWMLAAYKKRPKDFRRRILFWLTEPNKELLLEAEQRWLNLIDPKYLSTSDNVMSGNARYYNHKRLAKGGSTKGHKKKKRETTWNKGVTKEMKQKRKEGLFCLLSDRPKNLKSLLKQSPELKICSQCEGAFQLRKSRKQTYCSRSCSRKAASGTSAYFDNSQPQRCDFCTTEFYSRRKQKCCSRSCSAKIAMTTEAKENLSRKLSGKIAWNKGIPNSRSAELGKATAEKQSRRVTGRKIAYRADGTRYWVYPDDGSGEP